VKGTGFTVSGSHAVVTGGSRGIGAALAAELAGRGARVTVLARSREALTDVAGRIGGGAVVADLADPAIRETLIARIEHEHGPVDLLVNNAAIVHVAPLWLQSAEQVAQTLGLNLIAPVELARQVLPGMIERRRGMIVNLSSAAAMSVVATVAPYCAAKAGLAHFSATLQRELRGSGVRMMIAHLGQVDGTDMMADAFDSPPIAVAARRMHRLGVMPGLAVDEVAHKVVDAVRAGKQAVILPPQLAPLHHWREVPSRLNDLVTAGREARLFDD